jgi:membrane protein YqaA with SNARE-associated domain
MAQPNAPKALGGALAYGVTHPTCISKIKYESYILYIVVSKLMRYVFKAINFGQKDLGVP